MKYIASDFHTRNVIGIQKFYCLAPEKSAIWLFELTLTDGSIIHLFHFIYLSTRKDKGKSLWQLNETTLNLKRMHVDTCN